MTDMAHNKVASNLKVCHAQSPLEANDRFDRVGRKDSRPALDVRLCVRR